MRSPPSNLRKAAGIVNITAGVILAAVGFRQEPRQTAYMVIGCIFIFIGLIRLRMGSR